MAKASANLTRWTEKLRDSELDMRNGAWRRFGIDEAVVTSDRRKAERAAKNQVPVEGEPAVIADPLRHHNLRKNILN